MYRKGIGKIPGQDIQIRIVYKQDNSNLFESFHLQAVNGDYAYGNG
jgi:hypothetical protein